MECNRMRRIRLVLTISLAVACAAWGKIIYVDDDANAPGDGSSWPTAYKFLQDALNDASLSEGAAEVRVAQGLYKPDRSATHPNGTGSMASFCVLYGMTVRGGFAGLTGVDPNERDIARYASILSGDLAGNDTDRADPLDMANETTRADNSFHVITNFTGTRSQRRAVPAGLRTELDGFTVTGGHAPYPWGSGLGAHPGGGIYIRENPLNQKTIVRNCTIVGNYARSGGGGIACLDGTLDLIDCTLVRNGTLDDGGGAYILNANVEFSGCRFQANRSAISGGGAYVTESNAKLDSCNFNCNVASSGGALGLAYAYSTPRAGEVVGCTFAYNRADDGYGGAVKNDLDTQFRGCRFLANEAGRAGGAISSGWDMMMLNCLFSGNRAGEGGGAIDTAVGEVHLLNCTAHGNRSLLGQFLFWDYCHPRGYVDVENSIIADGGNEIWHNCFGRITLNFTDLIGGLAAVHDPNNKVVLDRGNIDVDPCFVAPGYWDPNGTPDDPGDDFFVDGDYRLKSQAGRWDLVTKSWVKDDATSLCIDAGDPNSPVSEEPLPNGGRINMGAYGGTDEASKSHLGGAIYETTTTEAAFVAAHRLQRDDVSHR
jgi:hypothetical protein